MKYVDLMGPGTGGPESMNENLTSGQLAILDAAATITTFMRTQYTSKNNVYGGYNIYEDGKIHISMDTYVPNVSIGIMMPDKPGVYTVVFCCAYGGRCISIFHPGTWIDYLTRYLLKTAQGIEGKQTACTTDPKYSNFGATYSNFGAIDSTETFP